MNESAVLVTEQHDIATCHFCTTEIDISEPMYEATWLPTGEIRHYHEDCYMPDEPSEPDGLVTVPGFGTSSY